MISVQDIGRPGMLHTVPLPDIAWSSDAVAANKPYRGPESYRVEDGALFFGRDGEAESILATVLSSRFTLLHAPSGAGKSSLLNAKLMPSLEARGWLPVRTTPRDDPTAALRHAAIDQLLPPPEAEIFALAQACRLLVPDMPDPTVRGLIDAYRALPRCDDRRRLVASPVRVSWPIRDGQEVYAGPVTPFVTRLLRGSMDMDRFSAHVAALRWEIDCVGADGGTRVSELVARMGDPAVRQSFMTMLLGLATYPVFGLRAFFEELHEQWGRRHQLFAVVLILDQFEELFTRFVDRGAVRASAAASLLDWRLRKEFFREIERLFSPPGAATQVASGPPFPIRCTVAIRNEFVAQLDELRRIEPTLAQSTVHLSFLHRDNARDAILQPAGDFGYAYDPELLDDMLARLTREGEFVEPAQLQIVCDKLWAVKGASLAADRAIAEPARAAADMPVVDLATYQELGGAEGILAGFFREYIDGLAAADRLETLEMLEPLITSSGTRNIAEWGQLVAAPFRDEMRRVQLLYELARRNIVRFEARLGGRLVEVTHEFLIPAIQAAIAVERSQGAAASMFRQTLTTLEGFRYQDFRGSSERLLMLEDVQTLHANRDRIVWTAWAVELMLRSSMRRGAGADVVAHWVERHLQFEAGTANDDRLATALDYASRGLTLSRSETDLLHERRMHIGLTPAQSLAVLRSVILHAADNEQDRVAWWARLAAAAEATA